jgi:hypothetical protein
MNFVVTRHAFAALIEQQAGGAHFAGIFRGQGNRPAHYPQAVIFRLRRQKTLNGAVTVLFNRRQTFGIVERHEGEILRQHHELRAGRGGGGNLSPGGIEIVRHPRPRRHLYRGHERHDASIRIL